jgi:hypothetical protein
MVTEERKKRILEDAGFAYSFDRLSYINRQARKVFSIEFVQDNDEAEIRARIGRPTPAGEWEFNFNSKPTDSVKREFLRSIAP